VSKAYQGAGEPGENIIPPAYGPYRWQPPEGAYAYDPDKTRQLLDDAGYKVGSDGWRTMPDGSPIGTLRLFARSDSESSINTMALFKEYLDDVQINSKVTQMESSKLTNIILDGDYDTFQWGWYVEPDPDSMLSYFTCAQRGGWSDSWMCDKTYDKLYTEQNQSTDQAQREDIVKQMQQMLYDQAPYLVTAYNQIGEAYRSDRWEGFVQQPDPGGILLFQYGHANYLNLQPAGTSEGETTASGGGTGDGIDSGAVIAIGISGLILFVGGGLVGGWAGYRKASVDFRE
jgi:peptide/nickel transport system substrate-binding protein